MYGNNYYQPYSTMQRPIYQQQYQQQIEPQQTQFLPQIKQGLQGKMVEGYEQAKVCEINLDGSTSFFPSTDGTKIFTKQLQMDGNVKISTYVLDQPKNEIEKINYATKEDLEEYFNTFKEDMDEIKKALKKAKKEEL